MFPRAFCPGQPCAPRRQSRRAFTLLEMCIVLLLIVIMAAVATPALHSVFVEAAMRADTRELSVMIKTAMLQCGEQNRPYVVDLTTTSIDLHPLGAPSADAPPVPPANDDDTNAPFRPEDITATQSLDTANKFLLPHPDKPNVWQPVDQATWQFEPGSLCPVPRIRVTRGSAWLEVSFNALTGNPENESAYFP